MPERTRVIAQQWISADGFAAGPNGEQDIFGAVSDFGPGEEYNQRLLDDVDTVILGRKTYESFVQAWPNAEGEPMAELVNTIPKVVCSRTLTDAPWDRFAPAEVEPDAVEYVRRRRGSGASTLLIWGSLALMRELLASGDVDELDLFVAPIALGSGTPLVAPDGPYRLEQIDAEVWPSALHVRYAVTSDAAAPRERVARTSG